MRKITIKKKIKKRLKKSHKNIKLEDYTWGFGLEHEMHLFHKPDFKNIVTDFILFDGEAARMRLLTHLSKGEKSIKLSENDLDRIFSVPFEPTGRKCNGKWVIKKVPFNMPEFITSHPFCNLKRPRTIENMCKEVKIHKNKFLKALEYDPITKKQIQKYGKLVEYPFSMTSYMKNSINSNNTEYKFKKGAGKNDYVRTEYLGSYHITITLPYLDSTTQTDFIKMHMNFANQLQWLEPLLLTGFFSADQRVVGSKFKRARGSFRVMIIGWGNFAGSDVRRLDKGVGRYSNIKTFWRDGLKFKDINKLKPCYPPSPAAKREKGISTLSSNFRTFGSTDPDRPWHRESGVGMTKPNGIEFRIFDHFSDTYLPELCKFMIMVAENSRTHKTKGYVYKNKSWITAMHTIMEDGWKAQLSKSYINLLRNKLDIKINTKSRIAYDILHQINEELYIKNKNGDWAKIMNGSNKLESRNKPLIPTINRDSIEMAFAIKFNRNPNLFNNLNRLIYNCRNKMMTLTEFKKEYFIYFKKSQWESSLIDFIYYLEYTVIDKIYTTDSGKIKKIKFSKEQYHFDNFNETIKYNFNTKINFTSQKNI